MKLLSVLALFYSCLSLTDGLKILGVLPFPSRSHWMIGHEIIKSLVDAGHEATVLTAYPSKSPIRNYEEIDISEIVRTFEKEQNVDPFALRKLPLIAGIPFLHFMGSKFATAVFENQNVVELLKRKEKYDICFLETFHANAISGIFDHFDCIYIPYTSSSVLQWADVMTSNLSPSSYVVTPILPLAGKLNFAGRFWNTLYIQIENLLYYSYHKPSQRKLYNKYFPNAKRSYDEMINGVPLIFLSSHNSVTGGRPYLPNMIEIGGIHIPKKKELPKDIQEFLDSATDGAVVFTMGSIVKAQEFPEHIRVAFTRAFGKIKQKVLWKYENETLPNKPDNLMISPWIPQRDILAHPNVKLFISHGGYLGTTEATKEGVPILGMPMYGDQGRNIAEIAHQERGLLLDIDDITEETILNSLTELLNNPKYKKNAEEVAQRFNDRVMTPQQEVVYWTEYVARHKGAPFLRAAGCDLSAIEFYSLDVYGLMLAILLVGFYIKIKILKLIFRKLTGKSGKKQKTN
ncbi:UDP-glycosyltransferase UGT5-like isoform X2 [Chironomus tepperi]|uniref:UDP-glycosyltransferase UGT5-like isoform X2 n=2 Tax=Chironomus tepperi TaxID=113505 RepID=UPI00391F83CE